MLGGVDLFGDLSVIS